MLTGNNDIIHKWEKILSPNNCRYIYRPTHTDQRLRYRFQSSFVPHDFQFLFSISNFIMEIGDFSGKLMGFTNCCDFISLTNDSFVCIVNVNAEILRQQNWDCHDPTKWLPVGLRETFEFATEHPPFNYANIPLLRIVLYFVSSIVERHCIHRNFPVVSLDFSQLFNSWPKYLSYLCRRDFLPSVPRFFVNFSV